MSDKDIDRRTLVNGLIIAGAAAAMCLATTPSSSLMMASAWN